MRLRGNITMGNVKIVHYQGSMGYVDKILSVHYFEEWPTDEEVDAIVKPLTPYTRHVNTGKGVITDYGSHTRFLFNCLADVEVEEGMSLF